MVAPERPSALRSVALGSTSLMPRANSGNQNCSSQLEASQEVLDRPCLTVPVLRNEVDTGVDVAPARPLLPQPHPTQQRLVGRIVFQKPLADMFKLPTPDPRVSIEVAVQAVEISHLSHRPHPARQLFQLLEAVHR